MAFRSDGPGRWICEADAEEDPSLAEYSEWFFGWCDGCGTKTQVREQMSTEGVPNLCSDCEDLAAERRLDLGE